LQLEPFITPAYVATMCVLGLYGAHRVWLLLRFRWADRPAESATAPRAPLPITVQLPVFNERTVAARLVRAAGALRYPRDLLEIQVLDDSNDETSVIVDAEVDALRAQGVDAQVVRRGERTGFKAGALDHGLETARGELVCIFDADFVPEPTFLEKLVGAFDDPKVGMVQARWGHKNREESLLTRAESTLLDGHFVIEHKVRSDGGLFFNFNGTAGIWRRAAIESAGGWEHDTLTEDLDLSYRAQLAGWTFVYAPYVVAPAEVPPDIAAFKSQQHRWAKGSVQVLRKLGWRILFSREPLRVKLEAFAHLSGNVGYPCVLFLSLLLPLSVGLPSRVPPWMHPIVFALCTLSVLAFYDRSQRAVGRPLSARLHDTLVAILLGIGMCVSQTRAVLEGLLPGTGVFVRTPKRGDSASARRYRAVIRGLPGIELLFAAWFAWGLYAAAEKQLWGSLPFLLLFFASFLWVGSLSLRQWARG
jgi:cellulose synthase/poly-beta-1,6-N-acetylglucosamine synthase-like glycosyltransferase